MKLCTKCDTEKDFFEFRKRSASKDGFSTWCRNCFAEYDRERYANGDKARKDRNKQRTIHSNRVMLWELLNNSQCIDCGETDPIVLEFDHRDREAKTMNISEMMNYGWGSIKKEIDKCDIRCANCHRRRTAIQLSFWKVISGA